MKRSKLTSQQVQTLARLVAARRDDRWFRAGERGDRHCRAEAVTLASLYYRGLAERRPRSSTDKAFEYRATELVMQAAREAGVVQVD